MNVKFDTIIFASSSFGTQAGLMIGNCLYAQKEREIYGISITKQFLNNSTKQKEIILNLIKSFDDTYKTNIFQKNNLSLNDVILDEKFNKSGYGIMSETNYHGIEMFAKKEAIFLDPVYTGRTGGALIELVKEGTFSKEKNILFIFTGGTPTIFTDLFKHNFHN